jgi:hypothetical protein
MSVIGRKNDNQKNIPYQLLALVLMMIKVKSGSKQINDLYRISL